ncbi:MAG TPA: hypothetical protein VNE63_16915, partial [Candidatus Acidoferrales bacterium]|nr:hypothetical protein [Candidatus Acidoferrales bacterium]
DDTSRTTAVSSIESQPPRLCIEDAQFAERGIQRARSTSAFPGDAISGSSANRVSPAPRFAARRFRT